MSRARGTGAILVGAAALFAGLGSCGPRVEYRARPGFTTSEDLPDEVVLDDGTIIRYIPLNEFLARKRAREAGEEYRPPGERADARASTTDGDGEDAAAGRPSFVAWEEFEDGTVRMQARMPEQLVANTMRAFREQRYAELWDQMVAPRIRERAVAEAGAARAEEDGRGARPGRDRAAPDAVQAARDRFDAWCAKNREEVMKLLNRMSFGFNTNAIIMRRNGPNSLSLELSPQIAGDFRYRVVDIDYDGDMVLLAGIRPR